MSTDLLFEHFATLATASGGISRLRELILQLAVHGKLGTQDAGDEPASVLLERIKKEKKQLIKDGKIRQEQSLEPIENNRLQNSLPDKWCLSKLGEYCLVIMGQSPESKFYNENGSGLPFYQGKSEFGKLFPKPRVWCENSLKIAQKNDILISVRAPVGPTNICPSVSCIGRGLTALRSLSGTSHFFLLYSLRAYEKLISEMGVGSTFSAISKKDLYNFVIAVPPLAEQYRIVAKVDRLMAYCDELEARQQQERVGCLRLGTASLTGLQDAESPEEFGLQWAQVCDAFDLILDCPENVAVLRQTILQLAVQGRLVRQEPGDEPAGKLVERIKKEKEQLKKERKLRGDTELSTINHEEIPFSTPMNWVWEKVGNISFVTKLAGFEYTKYISLKDHGEIPVIRAQNVRMGRIEKNNLKYIDLKTSECLERSALTKPAILMTFIGAGIGDVAIFWEKTRWHLVTNVAKIEPFNKYSENIDIKYFLLYLMSNTGREEIFKFRKSTAQPSITMGIIREINIVLPPLAEQHRIVAKVDALMALCDVLESQLKERAGVQGRLAGAVVKGIA